MLPIRDSLQLQGHTMAKDIPYKWKQTKRRGIYIYIKQKQALSQKL